MIKPRPALFKWRHFDPEIIVCAVRWYLRFSLSYRDVEELLVERGLPADHTTIWRWVQRYAPELNKRCRRELKPTNGSWRVDETYICQGGNWRYLHRAVDSTGTTIDFWFSAAGDYGGWHPVLPEGDRGAEVGGKTGRPMPLSNLPVSKRCGTGPPRDQAPGERQPGFSILRWSVANDSRLRDSAHDPERPSEVVAERGCAWTDSVHP